MDNYLIGSFNISNDRIISSIQIVLNQYYFSKSSIKKTYRMNKLHKNYWGLLGEWLIGFNSKISRVNCFTSDGKYLITSENTGGKIEHWVYDLEKKKKQKNFLILDIMRF